MSHEPTLAGHAPARQASVPVDLTIILLATAGIALRIWHLVGGRSLWLDEGRIATNFLDRSFAGLLLPLDNFQSAAIGWLWLEKATYALTGDPVTGLRLWPLLFGIAGLILFLGLARRELAGAPLLFLSVAVSLLPTYLYFSAEIKPYISDFCFTAALLWLGFELLDEPAPKRHQLILLAGLGIVALLLSQPVALILGGVGGVLIIQAGLRRRWREAGLLIAISALWAALFLLLYLTVYSTAPELMSFMRAYWGDSFAPVPPRSPDDLLWYYRALIELPTAAFYHGRFMTGTWGTANVLCAILLLLGCWRLAVRQPLKLTMLLLPLLFALVASAVAMWPFDGRLLLFTAPIVLLLAGFGLTQLIEGSPIRPALAIAVPAFVLVLPLAVTVHEFSRPHRPPFNAPDLISAMRTLAQGYQPGDAIYIMNNMDPSFRVHGLSLGLGNVPFTVGRAIEGMAYLLADTERLRDAPRVWVLFATHFLSEGRRTELELARYGFGRFGREVERRNFEGATLLLYQNDPASQPPPGLFPEPARPAPAGPATAP
jgi:hypothetical protein